MLQDTAKYYKCTCDRYIGFYRYSWWISEQRGWVCDFAENCFTRQIRETMDLRWSVLLWIKVSNIQFLFNIYHIACHQICVSCIVNVTIGYKFKKRICVECNRSYSEGSSKNIDIGGRIRMTWLCIVELISYQHCSQ